MEIILEREEGPGWHEVNIALQQVMADYGGWAGSTDAEAVRSETILMAGLSYVRMLTSSRCNMGLRIKSNILGNIFYTKKAVDIWITCTIKS